MEVDTCNGRALRVGTMSDRSVSGIGLDDSEQPLEVESEVKERKDDLVDTWWVGLGLVEFDDDTDTPDSAGGVPLEAGEDCIAEQGGIGSMLMPVDSVAQ